MKATVNLVGDKYVAFPAVDNSEILVRREDVIVRYARRDMYGRLCYLVEATNIGIAGLLWYDYTDKTDRFVRSFDFHVVSGTTFNKYKKLYNITRGGYVGDGHYVLN